MKTLKVFFVVTLISFLASSNNYAQTLKPLILENDTIIPEYVIMERDSIFDEETIKWFQSFGYGFAGESKGSSVTVFFKDFTGPGWLDSEGSLCSVIYTHGYAYEKSSPYDVNRDILFKCARSRHRLMTTASELRAIHYSVNQKLFEFKNYNWIEIPGDFEKITKTINYEGKDVTANFFSFTNPNISKYSMNLLESVGCSINNNKDSSKVRLSFLENRNVGIGIVYPDGTLKLVSPDGWGKE